MLFTNTIEGLITIITSIINNNNNDNNDNNNSNDKMDPKTIKDILTFTLGLHFPSSFVLNRQIFIGNGYSFCIP